MRSHGSGLACYSGYRPESGISCEDCRRYTRERDKRWRAANPDKDSECYRRWRTNNLEHNAERMRKYRADRAEAMRIYERNRRRRPRKFGAERDGHTREQVFERDGGICQICGVALTPGWHEDHIMPLSAGGSDLLSNVQATCPPCNLSKGAKTA